MRARISDGHIKDILVNLSRQDFASLGVQEIAYITPPADTMHGYTVRAADGQFLGEWQSRELAEAVLAQNGLAMAYLN